MGKPPARSRLIRGREQTVAFAEAKDSKSKKGDEKGDAPATPDDESDKVDEKADAPESSALPDAPPAPPADAPPAPPADAPPAPPADEPAPPPVRARAETVTMPFEVVVGKPPEVPPPPPPPPVAAAGDVESPTHLPHPRDVPGGSPDDAAPAPGRVPPGDSRSLRNANQFALIYRIGTFVITRVGAVGRRGVWRVVEYPTPSSASHAYAKESSRFVSEGFSDYRD